MTEHQPATAGPASDQAYLQVSRLSDGRYCVAFTSNGVSRRSYTPSLEQVVRQAQRAGGLPIATDDSDLRRRCQELALPLIDLGQE